VGRFSKGDFQCGFLFQQFSLQNKLSEERFNPDNKCQAFKKRVNYFQVTTVTRKTGFSANFPYYSKDFLTVWCDIRNRIFSSNENFSREHSDRLLLNFFQWALDYFQFSNGLTHLMRISMSPIKVTKMCFILG
jgi:hypothetical protein